MLNYIKQLNIQHSQWRRVLYDYMMGVLIIVVLVSSYRFGSYLLGITDFDSISKISISGLQSTKTIPPSPVSFYFFFLPGFYLLLIYVIYRESDKIGLLIRWARSIFNILLIGWLAFFVWIVFLGFVISMVFGWPSKAFLLNLGWWFFLIICIGYIIHLRAKLSQYKKVKECTDNTP